MKWLLLVPVVAWGQSVSVINSVPCGFASTIGNPSVLVFVPNALCLKIGAGLRLNVAAVGGPALEALTPVSLPLQAARLTMEYTFVPNDTPATQETMLLTAKYTPVPEWPVWILFKGSQATDLNWMFPAAVKPKEFTLPLPAYRPFNGEWFQLQYWTYDTK